MATRKPKGLGRGLDALLGADAQVIGTLGSSKAGEGSPSTLKLKQLQPGKYQPRTRMDEEALNELAESIRTQGIMQPILVRPLAGKASGKYEIIAGERRFRAATLAGLDEVPVLVKEVADEHAAAMALIENIQREDLNPLEEAQGVKRLLDEFGMTHEQAARAIGRSRSATSNMLRLLNLAEPVQTMLLAGDIDMGHARALLAADPAIQIMLANEVIAKGLSVRATEKLVGRSLRETEESPAHSGARQRSTLNGAAQGDIRRMEEALSDHLGTKVSLKINARKHGKLVIEFHGWDHLNALLERQGLGNALGEDVAGD